MKFVSCIKPFLNPSGRIHFQIKMHKCRCLHISFVSQMPLQSVEPAGLLSRPAVGGQLMILTTSPFFVVGV